MELTSYVKAGYPILYVQTPEGDRAEASILKTCEELKRKLRIWSITEGLSDHDGKNAEQIEDPIEALNRAKGEPPGTVLVVRNFHMFLNGPKIVQQMKDIARDFKQTRKTLIIVSAIKKLPPELERDITVIEFDLPSRGDIEFILTGLYSDGAKKKLGEITADERERIVQAAMGLTAIEAENALSKAFVEFSDNKKNNTSNDPISKLVMKEKANTVKKSGILEYFEAKQGANDIGGLENLKEWLTKRSKAFSKKARDFGIPIPRGILLVGLPGCGKSLSAKAASNILGIPLLRFDIGKVFGGLVGESERNMRLAIQTTEAVGNCVLWIDEMEKAFAGMGGSSTDGGTSQRVFGNFITWMQEKTTPCFIISTVNRIESLPPELLRKGRFDEMFFVGLPSIVERKTIFKIHTMKYGKNEFKEEDIATCAKASEGFSGAEIEESVITGLYTAFYHDRPLMASDVLKAVVETNPLSKSKKTELDAMASWAASNAINASRVNAKEAVSPYTTGRQLDL
jgi:SpoVK/Ycf46/Vps4 family AAA+-type ATPase